MIGRRRLFGLAIAAPLAVAVKAAPVAAAPMTPAAAYSASYASLMTRWSYEDVRRDLIAGQLARLQHMLWASPSGQIEGFHPISFRTGGCGKSRFISPVREDLG